MNKSDNTWAIAGFEMTNLIAMVALSLIGSGLAESETRLVEVTSAADHDSSSSTSGVTVPEATHRAVPLHQGLSDNGNVVIEVEGSVHPDSIQIILKQ